ncbi:hypothetical protein ABPG72_008661 [Tetrahymena utriculariae]
MTQLQANLDFSSQKLIFELDQRQQLEYKVIEIEKDILTFDFHQIMEELIKFLQDDLHIQNVEILQLTNKKLQFVSEKQSSDNQQFESLFGAADYLDYDFNDFRQLIFDLPKVYSSYSERLVLKDYELIIQNDSIKVKYQYFYSLRFRNYIGEIKDHMICVVFYKVIGLQYIPQQNIQQKQYVQFQRLEIQRITKSQLMHFIQKVLTIIAEGNYFYSLSKRAIFINTQQQCLEFIALPIQQQDNNTYEQDILSCENQIVLQILSLQQDFQYYQAQRTMDIFIGDCLYQQNITQVKRELPLICLSQQIGFPLYWYLFHNIVYMEIGPFQALRNKAYVVYKINDLYFYYDGKINNQNEKHSQYQEYKNIIYCFNSDQHNFITQFYQQSRFKSNQNQNDLLQNIESINKLFQENFKDNHNLVFEGCLKNNLPHGDCKIKIFLNPIAKQRILSLNSTQPFREALFKKNVEGNFDYGILDGEGYIYSYLNERQKEKIYFDNFLDVPYQQNQERVGNISMHFGKWQQRTVKKERYQDQFLHNKQYYYIYYDASEQNKKDGRELRQFRSMICYKEDKKPQQDQIKRRKVFINIAKTQQKVNYQKLFLKTNDLSGSEQVKVYVLFDIEEPRTMSAQLAQNIIFSFTENNIQINSQCITYINLSLIQNVSSLHIENQLDSSKSIIKGLSYKIYQELPSKVQQKIIFNNNNLDFSHSNQLLEEYFKKAFEFENIDIYKNLDKYADQINKRKQSSRFRIQSNQMNIKYSLTMRGCDLTNINYLIFNNISLRKLDISRAQVRDDFLNYLGTQDTQFLTSLNISYTTLLYSSVYNFFIQDKPKDFLETFICRSIQIQKNHIVQSVKSLFKHIIESDLLKQVKYLDISENPQVYDDLIRIIYGHLIELKHLKISQCQNVNGTDHQYLYIFSEKFKSNLAKLDFSGNNISFSYLQQSYIYRSLQVLDITNCIFKDQNLFAYLQTQKELYKIKLDYQIFAENNFQFLENIFKCCQKMRKIYLLVKATDKFDIEGLQRFISSGKLIDRLELNLYFNFQNNKNQLISNKETISKNYNKLLETNLFYVNQYPYVNIHFGKYQIVNKEAQDIDIKFNFQQLRGLKSGFIYCATQEQYIQQSFNKLHFSKQLDNEYVNTINLSNHFIQELEQQDIEPYFDLAKNYSNIIKFVYQRQEIDSKKCQKIISNIIDSKINKLFIQSSLVINNHLPGLSNLVVLQLQELKIECQQYDIFEQFKNFQLLLVNTLEIQFKQENKLDKTHLSKFIQIISVNKKLKISLQNYYQNNQDNKENQLSSIFSCFSEKYFTKCISFCLELKGIQHSSEMDFQRVSTIIENMSGCCQFSFTYLDSKTSDYHHFTDEIAKQINKFNFLELQLNNLDNNIIKFISSQHYLENLVLRIKDQDLHKQLPHLFKFPIKTIQIYSENTSNNEKIQKIIQKAQNLMITQIYLNDKKLV